MFFVVDAITTKDTEVHKGCQSGGRRIHESPNTISSRDFSRRTCFSDCTDLLCARACGERCAAEISGLRWHIHRPRQQRIYAYRFDSSTGKMTSLGLAAETAQPSFFVVDA